MPQSASQDRHQVSDTPLISSPGGHQSITTQSPIPNLCSHHIDHRAPAAASFSTGEARNHLSCLMKEDLPDGAQLHLSPLHILLLPCW